MFNVVGSDQKKRETEYKRERKVKTEKKRGISDLIWDFRKNYIVDALYNESFYKEFSL